MKRKALPLSATLICFCCPLLGRTQGLAGEMKGLQGVLDQLYTDMLPLCSGLMGVGRALAGFATLWYIGYRVWGHIARAEPIDFYPLLRPFVIGFAIAIFPAVLALINGVMQPTVKATASLVEGSDKAITQLLEQKREAIKETLFWQMYVGSDGTGDRDKWYQYKYGEESEGWLESIGNDIKFAMAKASYNFRNSVKQWLSELLQLLFQAAALCINTIRTFYLIVMAILGPLVFALSVFDGFAHTLTVWLARYLNIFLWLPVANIFGSIIGKVQEKMLALDIAEIEASGDTIFSTTDTAYLIFLIIGIIGYFTVPSVANYIVHAGGGNALLSRVSAVFSHSTSGGATMAVQGGVSMVRDVYGSSANVISSGMAAGGATSEYFREKLKGGDHV